MHKCTMQKRPGIKSCLCTYAKSWWGNLTLTSNFLAGPFPLGLDEFDSYMCVKNFFKS